MKTATPVTSKQETDCLGRHKHLNKVDGLVSCPKDLLPRKDSEKICMFSALLLAQCETWANHTHCIF